MIECLPFTIHIAEQILSQSRKSFGLSDSYAGQTLNKGPLLYFDIIKVI